MKSKLTLRLDDELKGQAKRFAERRKMSVSQLVEDYFRLLKAHEETRKEASEEQPPKENASVLTPRIERLKERLGRPAPDIRLDDDTRAWVDAAAEKHA